MKHKHNNHHPPRHHRLCGGLQTIGGTRRKATAEQFDKVKQETKEAVQDMKDYTFAQKTVFVEKMKAQMAELNRDLDQLMARVEKSSDAAKPKPNLNFRRCVTRRAKLNQQLDEVKNATESTWDSVKAGFKKGYGEVKDGSRQRAVGDDKIAP